MVSSTPFLILGAMFAMVGAWFSHRFGWWRRSVAFDRPRVLMYHMIRGPLPGGRFNKMRVSPALFRRQIEWLKREGWTFCFMSEIIVGHGEKRVAVTFDDGYRDNLLEALPVLSEFGAKATLFPVIHREAGYDWSELKKSSHSGGELGREQKLSDDEIRAMIESGLIELGGHSVTHANLPALDEEAAWREIRDCKVTLEERFGVEVPTFCYPFGKFGQREKDLVRKAGYVAAVTTEQGIGGDDSFALPRVKVSGSEGMYAFFLRVRTGRRGC